MTRRVLFVGGYGRSGSTLLDRMLGHCGRGVFSAGELRHVWAEGFCENRLCGCGRRFLDCPLWGEVTLRAFGGMTPGRLATLLELKRRVDRWWRIPQLAWPRALPAARRAELAEYRALLGRFYAAIFEVTGCEVVVDSTKDPSHGWVLADLEDVELRVLHLVRDPRAVAHSWRRRRFNPGSGTDMDRYGLPKTAVEWNAINALVSALRWRAAGYMLLRYEDLMADPARRVAEVLSFCGVPAASLPVDGALELTPDHTVAGNPMRFRQGRTELRPDEEWRRRMPSAARAAVTAMAAPGLLAYGFTPGRPAAGPAG